MAEAKKDYTGQCFGGLLVISEAEPAGGSRRVNCRCDCGNEKPVHLSSLKSGKTKSCGCLRSNEMDLMSQKFGRLTVIGLLPEKTKYNRAVWTCRCDCGKETNVEQPNLVNGHTTSCGCARPDLHAIIDEHHRVNGVVVPKLKQKVRSDSTTGHKGIYKNKRGKYIARLMVKGKDKYLGCYDNLSDAIAARKIGEEEYYKPYLGGSDNE